MSEMRCFLCVVKNVKEQKYDKTYPVITQYQGTPLCATCAKKVYERIQPSNELCVFEGTAA